MLDLTIDLGVPIPPDEPYVDLRDRAEAACRAIALLEENGFEIPEGTLEDTEVAAKLTAAYAADPEKTSKVVNHVRASTLTPPALAHVREYLDAFGVAVVSHAAEVRHLVTNRLLEESNNPDPRIRIRALELLGKISDVGLFSEKQEVTITHKTTDELRDRLRGKLQKLVRKSEIVPLDGEIIDVDAELGLDKPGPDTYEPESGSEGAE